ncbi:cadherin domain-containing protein, partial [Rubritalea squalenifaciens]|uniref:cadherin domain-containing protein n=1 Tax=Rubritalea squalenifaciens TaxID=407226 RepID=UPI0013566175
MPDSLVLNLDTDGNQTAETTVNLTKRSVRAPGVAYYRFNGNSQTYTLSPNDIPQVRTYRGTVAGDPNVIVCATILPDGTIKADAFDHLKGRGYVWQVSGYDVSASLNQGGAATANPTRPEGGMGELPMGVDINYHRFVNEGASDPDLAWALTEHNFNIYDLMMGRDTGVAVSIATLVTRENQEYYVPTGSGNHLNIIEAEWSDAAKPLRNAAWEQIFSYKTSVGLFGTGGYAWQNRIGKNETINYGQGAIGTQTLYHESGGHNWNAHHWGYGRDAMGSNRPNHGPYNVERVREKRDIKIADGTLLQPNGDYPSPAHPYSHLDLATTNVNQAVTISPLVNDTDFNGDSISIVSFTATTANGGTVVQSGNDLIYTPPAGYVGKDIIAYTIEDNSGAGDGGANLQAQDLIFIEVVNNGLTLKFDFNDVSGASVSNSTGLGHSAVLQSSNIESQLTTGPDGYALVVPSGGLLVDDTNILPIPYTGSTNNFYPFDSDQMSQGNFFDPMDKDYAICLWIKMDDVITKLDILDKYKAQERSTGFHLFVENGVLKADCGEIEGIYNKRSITNGGAVTAGQWHHVALVFDRTADQMKIFLDGAQTAQTALAAGSFIFHGREPLMIGSGSGGTMAVDDVRLYTQNLSSSDLTGIMGEASNAVDELALNNSLQTWWALDDNAGATASDSSGNANAGALSGGAAWTTTAVDGGGASFDGVDDKIKLDLAQSNVGAFTVAMWAKSGADGQGVYSSVFSNRTPNTGGTFQIDMGNGFQYRGSQTSSFGAAPLDQWVHLAVVSDGTDTILYYNGEIAKVLSGVNDDLFNALVLGANRNEGDFFQGEIDDFCYFDRALNPSEIQYIKSSLLKNVAPSASDDTFAVVENASAGTSLGVVNASDPNSGDVVSHAITGGNAAGLFAITAATGEITTTAPLDYETASSYVLTVTVSDDGGLSDTATITVNVTDVANDDSDADGLTDEWEVANFGSVAATTGSADSDGDGYTNAQEEASATDPNNAASNPTTQVLAHWSLNEGAGLVATDSSVNGYDGQLTGGTAWTSSAVDAGGASFDGVDDRIDYALTETNLGAYTVAMWVKNGASGQSIYSSVFSNHTPNTSNTFQIDMGNGFNYRGTQTASFGAAPVGTWVHLAVVSDGTDTRLYYNGVLSQTLAGVNDDLFDTITLGTNRNEGNFFQGEVDELYVYDAALNDEDILALATPPAPNQPPVATNGSGSVAENASVGTVVTTVVASDPDTGDTLSYSITAGNTGGAFAINSGTGEVTVAAGLDFESISQYILTVEVSDGSLTDTATVTIDVTNVNEAPVANNGSGSVSEGASIGATVSTVSSSDPDTGDSATYTITAGNTGGAFVINSTSGAITTATGLDYETTALYSLTVQVTDGGGLTDTATVTVNVTDVANDDSDADGLTDEWEVSNFGSVAAQDGSGDADSDGYTNAEEFAAGTDPSDPLSAPAPPDLVWTGAAGDGDFFNEANWDSDALTAGTQVPSADSVNVNQPLVASSLTVDSANFIGIGTVIPDGARIDITNTTLTTSGSNGFNTTSSTLSEFNIGTGADVSFQFIANTTVSLAGDAVLEFRGGGNPVNGSTIDLAADFAGQVRFTSETVASVLSEHMSKITVAGQPAVNGVNAYVVDVNGVTVVSLEAPNNAPVANDAAFTVAENAGASATVGTVSVSDPDAGDSWTYAITAGNGGGEFAINSTTGEITTTTSLDYEGASSYVLTVTVTDAGGLSDVATITVDVLNINEAPVANSASGTVSEDVAVGVTVATVTSSDPDANDTRTYAITAGNDGRFVINASTGEITTVSALDYETTNSYSLTVTVTDAGGLTATAMVAITVTDVVFEDYDSDSLDDNWEIANFGDTNTSDGTGDADADGLTDGEEYLAGSDPNSSDGDGDGFHDVLEINVGTDPMDILDFPASEYDGLVLWWNLDESAGASTVLDDTGNKMSGAVNGATLNGSEGSFDGSNDSIDLPLASG